MTSTISTVPENRGQRTALQNTKESTLKPPVPGCIVHFQAPHLGRIIAESHGRDYAGTGLDSPVKKYAVMGSEHKYIANVLHTQHLVL